ncbi:MAG: alpha/beta hydrolase, partial [Clostridia bacterium]
MKEINFKAYKDYELNLCIWDDVKNPKGVVQIVHGMAEHVKRYDVLAKFLNQNGYICLGDDHRAHGVTALKHGKLGQVTEDGDCFSDTVQDLVKITDYAKETYKLPVVIFGHSYGSFLVQRYIQITSTKVAGAIICGSACQNIFALKIGRVIANMQQKMFGKNKDGKMLNGMVFGAYDIPYKKEIKHFGWVTSDAHERDIYLKDEMCGYVMSIGFFRSFFYGLKNLYTNENLASIRKDLPVLLISGDKDPVGGKGKLVNKLYDVYTKWLNNVSIKLYKDKRHEIINETNRNEVLGDIL